MGGSRPRRSFTLAPTSAFGPEDQAGIESPYGLIREVSFKAESLPLLERADAWVNEAEAAIVQGLASMGVKVLVASPRDEAGIRELKAQLQNVSATLRPEHISQRLYLDA